MVKQSTAPSYIQKLYTPAQLAYFKEQGAKGGKASLKNMTAEERIARAHKAVAARIAKHKPPVVRQAKARVEIAE